MVFILIFIRISFYFLFVNYKLFDGRLAKKLRIIHTGDHHNNILLMSRVIESFSLFFNDEGTIGFRLFAEIPMEV